MTSRVRHPRRRIEFASLSVVVALASACGGGDSGTASSPTDDTTPDTTAPVVWEKVAAPAQCMCGDGSPWSYFVREADPTRVLFYLEGGGACFNAAMCDPKSHEYTTKVRDGISDVKGIFDLEHPGNPFADYSIVYVPYCTGDVHSGDTVTDYGEGVVMHHEGAVNAKVALAAMAERFPGAERVVVAGTSAGAFFAPIYGGMAADLLPAAAVKVFADSGGAVPDMPSPVIDNWGTLRALPDWPEFEGITVDDFTPTFAYIAAAEHAPDIAFARFDYAHDMVLSRLAMLAGLPATDMLQQLKDGEARIERTGTEISTWIKAGSWHTILWGDDFYTETMNGVKFVDWLAAFLDGRPLADRHCTDCTG